MTATQKAQDSKQKQDNQTKVILPANKVLETAIGQEPIELLLQCACTETETIPWMVRSIERTKWEII